MANGKKSRQLTIEAVLNDNNEAKMWTIILGIENPKIISLPLGIRWMQQPRL